MTSNDRKYPVFVLCGEDARRRRLMEAVDPDQHYPSKALLPFLGKRIIDWQMEALRQSPYVDELYIIGLGEAELAFEFPVHYVPSETTSPVGEKLSRGLTFLEAQGKKPDLVVISSSDAPGIQVKDINTFFEKMVQDRGSDVYISLVPESVAEAAFPKSGRVVARFKDWQVFPGELYALSPRAIQVQREVISELGAVRRKIDRKARRISLGPMLQYLARRPKTWLLILKYLLGLATLADGERGLSAAFGCQTRGIIIQDAGFGMDIDLPEDLERLTAYVKQTKSPSMDG